MDTTAATTLPDDYAAFLASKAPRVEASGIEPAPMPDHLMDFQAEGATFALRQGRAAIFYGTGLGKSRIQLQFLAQAADASNGYAILFTPLAVARQIEAEGLALGYNIRVIRDQSEAQPGINVCNYDRLDKIDPAAYGAVSLDEADILCNFSGATSRALTEGFANTRFRLCATATPAPNDPTEIAQHAAFLGVMDRSEILARWFINDTGTASQHWRLKGHAVQSFYDWMASWSRMADNPADMGFDGSRFVLEPFTVTKHRVDAPAAAKTGELFAASVSAIGMHEAKRETAQARSDVIAALVAAEPDEPWMIWCDTDAESKALCAAIPDAVEVSGSMTAERKEEGLIGFASGAVRVLVSKPSIAGAGMNFQVCARVAFVGRSFCFDEETEVLTGRGWLSFGEVTLDDDVAAIVPDTLEMRWERPSHVTWEPYEGPMVRFGGHRSFNLLVTPNHRMLVRECEARHPSRDTAWHFREAGDVAATWKRQELRIPSIPKLWQGKPLGTVHIPVRDDLMRSSRSRIVTEMTAEQTAKLAGWYLSEGHVRLNGRIIVISQTDLHPEHRAEIIELLTSLGLAVGSKTKDIYACSTNLAEWLVENFGRGSHNMRIPRWLKDADVETLTLLRDTMAKGDGSHSQGELRRYCSVSRRLQDDFQEICLKTGVKASVKPNQDGVALGFEFLEPSLSTPPVTELYSGMIGCVSVPSGAVLVRRHGVPVITGNSYRAWYQAVRRCWRFGQTRQVQIHVAVTEGEEQIGRVLDTKGAAHEAMKRAMASAMARNTAEASVRSVVYQPNHQAPWATFLNPAGDHTMFNALGGNVGKDWQAVNGDCVDVLRQMPTASVGFSVTSIPFGSLFTYSDSVADFGNSADDEQFFDHYGRLLREWIRVMKPGRLVAVHCTDLPYVKWKDGQTGIRPFSDMVSEAHRRAGFTLHCRITIFKDPVIEMTRTKALGLLYKQLKKDSTKSRTGLPDYLLVFRVPGENLEPVGQDEKLFPVEQWQKFAAPVWMDIRQTDTLNVAVAREDADERHLCALQLDLIERAILLWSNPGDVVLSPFMGIGSEGVGALKLKRKFVGVELKSAYYKLSLKHLAAAHANAVSLFDDLLAGDAA